MIVNIRGANGTGKSTLVSRFIDEGGGRSHMVDLASFVSGKKNTPKRVEGYGCTIAGKGIVVVGAYRTDCGGCDGIKTQALVKDSVMRAAKIADHVIFEGVIVSTIFQGYADLNNTLRDQGHDYLWAYLDTPLDVSLARIQQRNGGKPINEALVADKFRSIQRTQTKALDAGFHVTQLPYNDAFEHLKREMGL